ncbi:MAG: hypothetical protein JST87_11885 [Bacteroidetes bacterium]|nr:hypothetical protein [Bacteroidota bacterium]
MNNDLLNILSNSNKDIDNQKLMDYINGKLSELEKNEVEQQMVDNNFVNDALEGLKNIKDKKNLPAYIDQLNKTLQAQVERKKERREKRRLKEYPWIYFAIILILVLCIVAYAVIRQYIH